MIGKTTPCTMQDPTDPADYEPDTRTQWHCHYCQFDNETPQQDDVEATYICPDCFADNCLAHDYKLSETISKVRRRYVVSEEEARGIVSKAFYRLMAG